MQNEINFYCFSFEFLFLFISIEINFVLFETQAKRFQFKWKYISLIEKMSLGIFSMEKFKGLKELSQCTLNELKFQLLAIKCVK